jgi:hypothetical protein
MAFGQRTPEVGLNVHALPIVLLPMAKRNSKLPTNPFHPGGVLLEEFLRPGDISQSAFAERLGWTRGKAAPGVRVTKVDSFQPKIRSTSARTN